MILCNISPLSPSVSFLSQCLATYEAYQNALGIRSVALCKPLPSFASAATVTAAAPGECKFVALGSFDGKVRLLSMHSWQLAFALPLLHPRELEAGFNSARLLLTVEVAASAGTATRFLGGESGAGAGVEDGEGEDAVESLGGEAEGSVPPVKQHQVPPTKQVLRSLAYVPNRIRGVLLDKEGNAIQTGAASGSASGDRPSTRAAEEEEEAREYALLASMESFFALRNAKTLPRAQAFQLEGKRTNTSTLSSTARRTATGTSGSTGGAATSSSVSSSSGGFPAVGVSWVGWSSSSQLLAAREEAHPRCLWVWRPLQAQLLAVLVLLEPVTCARWRPLPTERIAVSGVPPAPAPASPSSKLPPPPPTVSVSSSGGVRLAEGEESEVLAFCTGTSRVYFWTQASGVTFSDTNALSGDDGAVREGGVEEVHGHGQSQGQGFAVTSLLWAKDGRSLILRGKEAHCICRVSLPALQQQQQRR